MSRLVVTGALALAAPAVWADGVEPPPQSPQTPPGGGADGKPAQGGAPAAEDAKPTEPKAKEEKPKEEKPVAKPVAPSAPAAAPAAAPARPAILEAAERLFGAPVHGSLSVRYRARTTDDETDQDVSSYLDVRVGDETKDRWSGALFMRAAADLDLAHRDSKGGYVFDSLADTSGSRVSAQVYDAYATHRPAGGAFRQVRLGRQYLHAGETFHFDGVSAATRPAGGSKVEVTAYGGVPVHLYEAGSGGDWLAGAKVSAEPWKGGRAQIDYTHVQDRLSILGTQRNDLAAVSLWQDASKPVRLHGRFTWLEGPRDATLSATYADPESDVLVQASVYRLFEEKREFATEFDPYYRTVLDLERYDQGVLRASKGFGETFDVEAGASFREVVREEREGPYNHDVRRCWVTPTLSGFPWDDASLSVTGEVSDGDGERIRTWGFDLSSRFGKTLRASLGSDFSLYDFGPLGPSPSGHDERTNVRTVYARARFDVTDTVSADIQYSWEKDDAENFHLLSLGFTVRF